MNPHLKGSLLIIVSMLFFSTQNIFVRHLSEYTLASFGYYEVFFLIFLSSFLFLTKRSSEFKFYHNKWILFSSAAVVVVLMLSYHFAIRMTTLANTILLHYTAPIFTFILAMIFLKEKFEWQTLFSIMIAIVGIILIFYGDGNFVLAGSLGIVLALLSGIMYAADTIFNKVLTNDGRIFSILFHKTWPIVILFSPFILTSMPPIKDLILLAAIGLFSALIPAAIFFNGIRYVEGQHVTIIAYVEVLFVILMGYLFFGEIPGKFVFFGGTLIILSGIWIIYAESKRKDKNNSKV